MTAAPIAIVGLGCRFPGAPDPRAYWSLLDRGVDAITPVPAERWDGEALCDPTLKTRGKMITRHGGFLEGVDQFDQMFFKIMPVEARRADPQHRLMLEVGWEALEDAGIDPHSLSGSDTGVYVGVSHSDHDRLAYQDRAGIEGYNGQSTYHCFAANRLSFFLNLRGPSMAIDSACSSSLVAVHLACQALRTNEIDVAIAGGVNLNLTPEEFIALSFLGVLSPDGRCKAFDARADGYGRGEGCGAVVLKRLDDALAAQDRVLGVIRGSAVNHDGLSNGITAPNGLAQVAVLERALKNAGVAPHEVSYIETMGTGTELGDSIEIGAISAAYAAPGARDCWLGAVKTNLGHLEAASGMASLIKLLLALEHERLPKNLHFERLSPLISLESTRLRLLNQPEAWPRSSGARIGAVSAFGFGGTNAHLIVEEAPLASALQPAPAEQLFTLSANSEKALAELAGRYAGLGGLDLADLCYTANVGRAQLKFRLATVVKSGEELRARLGAFARGERPEGVLHGLAQRRPPGPDEPPLTGERGARLGELAARFVRGVGVDRGALETRRKIALPTYPFQRVPCGFGLRTAAAPPRR
ncbi:MAG: beta-ketoacyl synthase N-terminal-like domain-containing protein [Myxococcota bacterium]